jgi:transposase
MLVCEAHGTPIAAAVASASPHEVTLVDTTLEMRFVQELPERMLGDGAYDSDPLDARLAARGIELIAPNRRSRRTRTQDGRPLRRYRRRWKVERGFAWLHNFRRIVTRWEYKAENYLAFVQLGCICILLRQF